MDVWKPCVGLFGTCDNVRWRDPFMAAYDAEGIPYFNPMVDNWHPGLIEDEKAHLENDPIVLFPVLSKSYGQGSLSELGFGIQRALRSSKGLRQFVALIDLDLDESLDDPNRRKDSIRSRKLVRGHIEVVLQTNPHVFLVDTLDQMLRLSLQLVKMQTLHHNAREGTYG